MTGAVAIEPVRDDAAVAAASDLARGFFAYMRAAFPEKAASIDAYLVAQDFEGQLADFRNHFNPPHGRVPARPSRRRAGRGRHAQALRRRRLRAQPDVRRRAKRAATASAAASASG